MFKFTKILTYSLSFGLILSAAPQALAAATGDATNYVSFTCSAQNIHRANSSYGKTSGKWFPGFCGASLTFENGATHEKIHRFVGCQLFDSGPKATCSVNYTSESLGIKGPYTFVSYSVGELPESYPQYGAWRQYVSPEGPQVNFQANALGNVFRFNFDVKHIKTTPY
jgi:hypothetical protein